MARNRRYLFLATAAATLMLGGCAVTPEPGHDVLDPRLAGPCDRLILSWPADVSQLQALVGVEFTPKTTDGVGEIELRLLQCQAPLRGQQPLTFAFLAVPITPGSAPFVVTGMPDDGWSWLPAAIADAESAAVFSAMGYVIEPAEIAFEAEGAGNAASLEAKLTFGSGSILIKASATATPEDYSDSHALVSTDAQHHSMFFGKETASRYEAVSVDIEVQGSPPLAVVDLARKPKAAIFDRDLRLERVYWQLPRSEIAEAPERPDVTPHEFFMRVPVRGSQKKAEATLLKM